MAEGKKDIVLSIRGMSKSFGRNKVLKHIDMDVPRGSIMGLMGENGAGKSMQRVNRLRKYLSSIMASRLMKRHYLKELCRTAVRIRFQWKI